MVFNKRLMSTGSEKDYLEVLREAKYDEYLNAKLNRTSSSFITKCEDLASFDAFDNYIAYTLLNNPYSLDPNLMSKYRDYLFTIFERIPNIVFESLLFNKKPAQLLFTKEQYQKIEKYRKDTINRCKLIYNKIKNGEKLTREESTIFFKFLIKNIDSENQNIINLLDDIYKRLLNSNSINNLLTKEFVLKYTAHIARKDLDLPPVEVYLTNTSLDGSSYSKRNYGTSYSNSGIISLNKDLIANNISPMQDLPCLIKFMQTVCHETKHSSQAYKASINDISYESFEYIRTSIFRSYISTENFNEYKANYRHNEIERDANLYGWHMVEKILTKYAPERKKEITNIIDKNINEFYTESLANKKTVKRKMPKEYYNADMMDKIIKSHPSLLQSYPQLTYIYNSNGSRKSFMELVENNTRLVISTGKSNVDKIFYDYFINDIKKGVLTTINVNALKKEEQFALFSRITTILINEIILIKRSMSILTEQNVVTFEQVNKERISRIKYLLNYLNSHKILINDLISLDISEGNKRVFGMHIRNIDDQLESLQRRFQRDKNISQTSIYNELATLSGGDIHGPHL